MRQHRTLESLDITPEQLEKAKEEAMKRLEEILTTKS